MKEFFKTIRKNTPCVVILDDLDSGYTSMSVSIQELLFEMDRLDKDDKIIFLATAVSIDNILKEFLKPKRFEKIISVSQPTRLERK